jgi:hypothetical protein
VGPAALFLILCTGAVVHAGILKPRAPDLTAKYEPFTLINGPQLRMVYGSYRGTLHLIENHNGTLVTAQSRDLWSPVIEMLAVDLDGDEQDEVVGYTQNSRLFILRGNDLEDVWNTVEGRFESITSLTVADVDEDGQPEIVLIADRLLRVYSALREIEEWKSSEEYSATRILVGDVDGDGADEIVLNTGFVLGAVFRDVEWTYEPGFGTKMDLFDIDSDGILEIVSMGGDGLVRVFDVDERRLKWN